MAQDPSIDAGEDVSVCPPECATLTATYVGGGGNTSDYTISDIPFAADPPGGTSVSLSDDTQTGFLPIGFDFCFYGNTYSEFIICSNNWIGFSGGETSTWITSPIPDASGSSPRNCIMGPWHDINPGVGGTITYEVLGTAPSRRLVVSYDNVPMFSCTDMEFTCQIIIYETTNIIENHISSKPICPTWNDGNAVQGIHNIDGTEAVVYAGRNNTPWDVSSEAIRFTPLGEPDVFWYDEAGVMIGEGTDIEVCPDVPTTYTVELVSCGVVIATDEVLVDVVCCEPPTLTKTDVTCFGACDGTATAEAYGEPPFTYAWDDPMGQTTATATGLCPGTYTVTVNDSEDCEETATITIEEPDELLIDVTLTHISCFGAMDGEIDITATGGTPPYTYNIGGGAGPVGTFTGLPPGDYSVLVTDDNDCQVAMDVTINEDPLPAVAFTADELSGCEPLTVVFTNTGESGISCDWTFGDGTTASSCGTISHEFETAGSYSVTLTVTDADGCVGTDTYTDYITVFEQPVASFYFSPATVSTIDTEVKFTNQSTGADGYDWTFGDEGSSSLEEPSYTFPEIEGDYPVRLIASTVNGCADTLEQIVRINQQQLIFAPNVITPDGDSFNEVFLPYFTGIDIYDYHLTIFNRWGEIVFESYDPSKGWNGTYGGEVVPDGVYIWQISTADIATDEKRDFYGHVTVLK
jgi:gliding motility-associated-like protein